MKQSPVEERLAELLRELGLYGPVQLRLLLELSENDRLYPYEVAKTTAIGGKPVRTSSAQNALRRLEEEGLAELELLQQTRGPHQRTCYKITTFGRQIVQKAEGGRNV